MPRDLSVLYALLQPYAKKDGDIYWMRVGLAYRNDDGTIDAYCDAMLVGHRFRLRELPGNECAPVTFVTVLGACALDTGCACCRPL